MRETRRSILTIAMIAALAFSIFFVLLQSVSADAPKAALTNEDCAKCHTGPSADMASAGGKHAEVGCTGCHAGHPPAVKNNIPKCGDCHTGKAHFDLKNCLGCHTNPHTPRKVSFGPNVTDACLTCHAQKQMAQLTEHKSKHSALYCSTCHDVHGKKPSCTQCHKPHAADMTADECRQCHKAHMPTDVTYSSNIPSKDCAACHGGVASLLASNPAKHKTLTCAFCHKERHKMIPECQHCHGSPHPSGIMAKFPKCGECHHIAHDLNHWPAEAAKPAQKATKAIKKKTAEEE